MLISLFIEQLGPIIVLVDLALISLSGQASLVKLVTLVSLFGQACLDELAQAIRLMRERLDEHQLPRYLVASGHRLTALLLSKFAG